MAFQTKDLSTLPKKLLAAKRANPPRTERGTQQADTSKPALSEIEGWEEEIDRLVYELYGLSEEEIRIVEGK